MRPLTMILLIISGILVFVIPKKSLVSLLLFNLCFIPTSQSLILSGASFYYHQLIILLILIRVSGSATSSFTFNKIDVLFFAWQFSGTMIYILQWQTMQAVIWKTGRVLEALTAYLLTRILIKGKSDINRLIDSLALIAVIMAPLVFYESRTGSNPFAILGDVITDLRDGRLRCQAAFPISIILGIFWSLLIPMFWMRHKQSKKTIYIMAIGASLFMIYACASSTPIGTALVGMLVLATYKYKRWYRHIVPVTVTLYVTLSFVMKAPPYYLIASLGVVGGSTAWHRAYLIDRAIYYFNEWALLGARTTVHWDYTGRTEHQFDITNQFILEGVRGGLITTVVFSALVYYMCKTTYNLAMLSRSGRYFYWVFMAFLSGHIVSFFGVSYFGQLTIFLYITIAMTALFEDERKVFMLKPVRLK